MNNDYLLIIVIISSAYLIWGLTMIFYTLTTLYRNDKKNK